MTLKYSLILSTTMFCVISPAKVLFKADFETGDLSEWSKTGTRNQNATPRNVQVVTDIVQQGKYAGKFTIHEDDVFNAQQLRAQVGGPKVTVEEGSDTYMSFYMYMAEPPKDRDNFFYWEGTPPPRYNNVMTWWVEPKAGGGTLIKYGTGNLGRNGTHWEADFTTGKWHQLAMHIHWSEDPEQGNTRLWFDGVLVLDKKLKTKGAETVYFCQPGIHRSPHRSSVDTIYFDNFILADTLEEVVKETAPKALANHAMPVAQQDALVKKYCAVCHTDAARNGGLSLEHFDAAQAPGSLAAMLVSKLTSGVSLETTKAAASDPHAAAVVDRKMKTGAMGAAGLPIPDKATIDALINALATAASGANKWSISSTPKLITASVLREAPRGTGEAGFYRLILTCNTSTHEAEMQLAWSPLPQTGTLSAAIDGKPPTMFKVESSEKMGNGSQVTAGPAAINLYESKPSLPAKTLRISNLFPSETVEFSFTDLPQPARRSLAACFLSPG